MSAMRVSTVSSESGSSRSEQYVRSSSLTRMSLPRETPCSAGTSVRRPRRRVPRGGCAPACPSRRRRRCRRPAGARASRPHRARRRPASMANRVNVAVGVDVEVGAQRVQAGGLEPLPTPVRQVAARRLLQRAKQIAERRVGERVVAEVVAQPGQERLEADVGDQLLEHAGALGVGDAVEVDLDGVQVGDVGGHRVRRRQLVLPVGPRLLDVGERRPGLLVLGGLGLAQHRGERREGLVEPQVVPPRHRDQVAEPHVRHLVQHRLGAPLVAVARSPCCGRRSPPGTSPRPRSPWRPR